MSVIKNWSTDSTDFNSRLKTISFFDNVDASLSELFDSISKLENSIKNKDSSKSDSSKGGHSSTDSSSLTGTDSSKGSDSSKRGSSTGTDSSSNNNNYVTAINISVSPTKIKKDETATLTVKYNTVNDSYININQLSTASIKITYNVEDNTGRNEEFTQTISPDKFISGQITLSVLSQSTSENSFTLDHIPSDGIYTITVAANDGGNATASTTLELNRVQVVSDETMSDNDVLKYMINMDLDLKLNGDKDNVVDPSYKNTDYYLLSANNFRLNGILKDKLPAIYWCVRFRKKDGSLFRFTRKRNIFSLWMQTPESFLPDTEWQSPYASKTPYSTAITMKYEAKWLGCVENSENCPGPLAQTSNTDDWKWTAYSDIANNIKSEIAPDLDISVFMNNNSSLPKLKVYHYEGRFSKDKLKSNFENLPDDCYMLWKDNSPVNRSIKPGSTAISGRSGMVVTMETLGLDDNSDYRVLYDGSGSDAEEKTHLFGTFNDKYESHIYAVPYAYFANCSQYIAFNTLPMSLADSTNDDIYWQTLIPKSLLDEGLTMELFNDSFRDSDPMVSFKLNSNNLILNKESEFLPVLGKTLYIQFTFSSTTSQPNSVYADIELTIKTFENSETVNISVFAYSSDNFKSSLNMNGYNIYNNSIITLKSISGIKSMQNTSGRQITYSLNNPSILKDYKVSDLKSLNWIFSAKLSN